jgi:6-phosphogluconolactonase
MGWRVLLRENLFSRVVNAKPMATLTHMRRQLNRIAILLASSLLQSCGESGKGQEPLPATYFVGFTVAGLAGPGLEITNGVDTISIASNGQHRFPTALPGGASYAVRVSSPPTAPMQACTVAQGAGAIGSADVTDIVVRCLTTAAPRFAYAFNVGEDSISIYNVDAATGQLRARGYVKTGPGGQRPVQDPARKFSFVLNSGLDRDPESQLALSSISVFAHDDVNGDLREIDGSPFVTSYSFVGASALTVHPGGKFVYVTTRDGVIFQWSVALNGTLTPINDDLVASGNAPRELVFDPQGRFAYLTHVDHESDGIYVYEADASTGALTERASLRRQFANRDLRTSTFAFHPGGKFAYVVNQDFAGNPGSLAAFAVDATSGALTPVAGQPYNLPIQADGAPVFDAVGRFAYVRSFGTPSQHGAVAGFSVDVSTGVLTPLAGNPYEAGPAPGSLSLTPSGDYLYVANRAGAGSITAFKVDRATGVLTRLSGIDSLQPAPFAASVDPSGRYLYAASLEGDRIHAFRIGAAGELQPISQGAVIRAGSQPVSIEAFVSHVVASPAVFAPKFVYVADTPGHTITSFTVDPASTLLHASGSVSVAGTLPRALAPSADGRFLHVAELAGFATTFAIDAIDGALASIDAGTVPAGISPAAIAAEPSNRFVYVANHDDGTVSSYRRDPNGGKLTATGSPFAVGFAPLSIAVDPTGRNLYAMSFARVRAFAIQSATGALHALPDDEGGLKELMSAFGTEVAVDPTGKHLFVVSPQGMLEVFPVDSRSGALGEGSVVAIDPGSISLTVDPTGRFLYTAGSTTSTISAFSINPETGAIAESGRLPLVAEPRQVQVDFSGGILWVLSFDNSIASLGIDAQTGVLTAIAHQPQQANRATRLVNLGVVR